MARQKDEKNKRWTAEERLKYVLMYEENHMSASTVARTENIPRGTLDVCIRRYRNGGKLL